MMKMAQTKTKFHNILKHNYNTQKCTHIIFWEIPATFSSCSSCSRWYSLEPI